MVGTYVGFDKENQGGLRRCQAKTSGKSRKNRGNKRQQRAQRDTKGTTGQELSQWADYEPRYQQRFQGSALDFGMEEPMKERSVLGEQNTNGCWWDMPASPVKKPVCSTPTTRASDSPMPTSPESRESKLAAFLRNNVDDYGSDRLDSVTHKLVDDAVATMLRQESMHTVNLPGLQRCVNLEHRHKIVAWFVQAFHVVQFDDCILYGVISLADRYLSICNKVVHGSELQGVVMACLCTTLKLETADYLPYSIPDLLAHITHKQISATKVAEIEREVLMALDFAVTGPNISHWLDVFSLRLTRMAASDDWAGFEEGPLVEPAVGGPPCRKPMFLVLADFLCQVSLINESVAARRPSLISASALLLSLETLQAPSKLSNVLLEDCGLAWDSTDPTARHELVRCCEDMRSEWCQPIDKSSAQTVKDKFESSLGDIVAWNNPMSVQFPAVLSRTMF